MTLSLCSEYGARINNMEWIRQFQYDTWAIFEQGNPDPTRAQYGFPNYPPLYHRHRIKGHYVKLVKGTPNGVDWGSRGAHDHRARYYPNTTTPSHTPSRYNEAQPSSGAALVKPYLALFGAGRCMAAHCCRPLQAPQ